MLRRYLLVRGAQTAVAGDRLSQSVWVLPLGALAVCFGRGVVVAVYAAPKQPLPTPFGRPVVAALREDAPAVPAPVRKRKVRTVRIGISPIKTILGAAHSRTSELHQGWSRGRSPWWTRAWSHSANEHLHCLVQVPVGILHPVTEALALPVRLGDVVPVHFGAGARARELVVEAVLPRAWWRRRRRREEAEEQKSGNTQTKGLL